MSTKIFIGSSTEGKQIANALQVAFQNNGNSYDITPWHQGVFGLSASAMESLENELDHADFAILILTPDDETHTPSRGMDFRTPRDNVILELGLFIGRLGRNRTLIVCEEGVKLPSDLFGITVAYFPPPGDRKLTAVLNPVAYTIEEHISTLLQTDNSLDVELRNVTERIIRQKQTNKSQVNLDDSCFYLIPRIIETIADGEYYEDYRRKIIITPSENGEDFFIEDILCLKIVSKKATYRHQNFIWFLSEEDANSVEFTKFVVDGIDMLSEYIAAREVVRKDNRHEQFNYGVKYSPITYPNASDIHEVEVTKFTKESCKGVYEFSHQLILPSKYTEISFLIAGEHSHKWSLDAIPYTSFYYSDSPYAKEVKDESTMLTHNTVVFPNWVLPGTAFNCVVCQRTEL